MPKLNCKKTEKLCINVEKQFGRVGSWFFIGFMKGLSIVMEEKNKSEWR